MPLRPSPPCRPRCAYESFRAPRASTEATPRALRPGPEREPCGVPPDSFRRVRTRAGRPALRVTAPPRSRGPSCPSRRPGRRAMIHGRTISSSPPLRSQPPDMAHKIESDCVPRVVTGDELVSLSPHPGPIIVSGHAVQSLRQLLLVERHDEPAALLFYGSPEPDPVGDDYGQSHVHGF